MLKESILSCGVDDDGVPFKFNQIHKLIFEKGAIGISFRCHSGAAFFANNNTIRTLFLFI